MSFKDTMSLIPSSVSVISCFEEGLIYGCTISSLVSVDVREDNPEIIFVLKKQSLVGEKIKTNKKEARVGPFFKNEDRLLLKIDSHFRK